MLAVMTPIITMRPPAIVLRHSKQQADRNRYRRIDPDNCPVAGDERAAGARHECLGYRHPEQDVGRLKRGMK